ncbi:DUF6571 family protein [Streptomyces cacaoi]|uniref:DUF6571 family protein n=1 Tax=Streptomyces cacaoi TaxID=1898 RepID=UPI0011F1EFCC|nr:DUF6571 family protein [Streptomyces cacaoi]
MKESKVTYTDLLSVDFASLESAVADWEKIQSKLKTRAGEAENDMNRKARDAVWEGANAGAVRPFVRKIAEEVGDLRDEAESIHNLISGACKDLIGIQKKVKSEAARAKELDIHIKDNGDGTVTCEFPEGDTPVVAPHGEFYGGTGRNRTDKERKDRDEIEQRINSLIGEARTVDGTARYVRKAVGNSKYDAGHATYSSLDDAQSREAADLGKKELRLAAQGKELPTAELSRFRDLTKYNADDPEFATGFYRRMGAKNALRLHAQLGIDASTDGGDKRLKLSRSIQNSMDKSLALATQDGGGKSGDAKHLGSDWRDELKKAGKEPIHLHDPQSPMRGKNAMPEQTVLGYQALSNMLRHGKYDKDFLTEIGNDMVETERGMDRGSGGWPGPQGPRREADMNLDPKGGRGFDPMVGLMKGLSNNPDAATDFFNGNTGGGSEDDAPKKMSNFDYFLGRRQEDGGLQPRDWSADGGEKADALGKDAMGSALEAATTGRTPGDSDGPSKHSAEQADLFHKTVRRLGDSEMEPWMRHGGKLAPLQSHMGDMAADYMRDIQRAITDTPPGLLAEYGEDAQLSEVGKDRLGRFVRNASQDPDGYASIMHSSHGISAELMREAMHDPPEGHSLSEAASMGAQPGAHVAAQAAEGRADGIEAAEDKVGAAERYNESLEKKQELVGQIVDMGLGKLPYGSDAASQVAGAVQEAVFGHYQKDPEEIALQVEEGRRDFLTNERRSEAETMKEIAKTVGGRAGVEGESLDWVASSVYRDVDNGFPQK